MAKTYPAQATPKQQLPPIVPGTIQTTGEHTGHELSAEHLRQLGVVGRDAREDFRNKVERSKYENARPIPEADESTRNRYREMLSDIGTPRTGREKKRVARYKELSAERDAEIATAHQETLDEIRRTESPVYVEAKNEFAAIIQRGVESPEDAADIAVAREALKGEDYQLFYKVAHNFYGRRLDEHQDTVKEAMSEAAEARSAEASAMAVESKLRASGVQLRAAEERSIKKDLPEFDSPKI